MDDYSRDRMAVAFLFDSGVYYESKRVNLEIGRGLLEFHQKKTMALEDVLRPELAVAPSDFPLRKQRWII